MSLSRFAPFSMLFPQKSFQLKLYQVYNHVVFNFDTDTTILTQSVQWCRRPKIRLSGVSLPNHFTVVTNIIIIILLLINAIDSHSKLHTTSIMPSNHFLKDQHHKCGNNGVDPTFGFKHGKSAVFRRIECFSNW